MASKRKTPLRVLFVVQVFFPSQAGGPANSVYWITKHLDKREFQSIIVSGDLGLPHAVRRDEWTATEAGEIIYVRNRVEKMSLRQSLIALRKLPSVDIVHLSSLFYPPSLLVGIVARLLGKKVLWSVRGEVDEPTYSGISGRRKKAAVRLLRSFIRRDVLFHSTCDAESVNIRHAFGPSANVVQIPNFMEIPELEPPGALDYLLFLGRIHPKKGLENLFTALSESEKFLASGLSLKVAGVGNPPYEKELQIMAAALGVGSRIQFLGSVVGRAKQQLLSGARFTIMPSFCENFGMVVLESLAQNTPVIASTGSPWAILEKEQIGLWVDNDPGSLASAIDRMLELSLKEYGGYRAGGRKFVEERFAIDDNIHEWSKAYDRLLGPHEMHGRSPSDVDHRNAPVGG